MTTRRKPSALPKGLRTDAEELLAKTPRNIARLPAEDIHNLVHELQVHQLELEMQNEELRRTQLELEAARQRLLLPYEAAPVGFLTLDAKGVIRAANPAAARLLNLDRVKLVGQKLTHFIAPGSQDESCLCCRQLFRTGETQTCELRMLRTGGGEFAATLEAVVEPADQGQPPGCLVVLSDVTEQKRAAATLQAQEEPYRKVVEASPDAIFILRQNRFVLINRAGLKLFGASRLEEMIGRDVFDFIHPGCRDLIRGRIALAMQSDHPLPLLEQKLLRLDGSAVEAEASSAQVQFQGQPALLVEVRDITERKRAEAALAESQARNRAIIDSTTDMIWSVDTAGFRLQTFNRSLQEFFLTNRGIRLEVGMRPEDLFQSHETDFAERWKALYQRALDSGSFTTEYAAYGGATTLLLTFCPLKHEEGVFGVSVFGQDITGRKLAEQKLRESQERYALAEQATQDGLWDWNILTNGEYFSPRWKEIIGLRDDELPSHKSAFLSRIHPEDLEAVTEITREHLATGKRYEIEFRLRHRDGSYRWVFSRGRAVRDEAGRPIRMVGATTDITESKQAEAALRKSEEKYRSMLTDAPVGIFQSVQDRVLFVNPAMAAMFGYASPAEMLAGNPHPSSFYVHPEQRSQMIIQALSSGTYVSQELQERRKDGSIFTSATHLRVVSDAAGNLKFIEGFVQDITGRLAAAAALESERNLLRTLIDHIPGSIFVRDTANRFVLANEIQARNLGAASPADLLGKTDADFFSAEQAARFAADDRRVFAGQALLNLEQSHSPSHWQAVRDAGFQGAAKRCGGKSDRLDRHRARHHRTQADGRIPCPARHRHRAGGRNGGDHRHERHDSLCESGV